MYLILLREICKKCVVFLKNLHSWQEFYTTAGRGGRDKGAGASEAGGQTKEGPLSKRYFQTSKIAQNRTKSPVPIVIDVFGVTAPYGNPYGSKIAIVWLFFVIF